MYKVLIADDEVKVCRLIENVINWEALGLQVIGVVNDGAAALQAIRAQQPDIVITDIRMPGIDGLALIEKAKEMDEEITFIIISGHRQFEYARNAMRYGVEDYLLKPLDEDELSDILTKLIHKKENRRESQNREASLHKQIEADSRRMQQTFMEYLVDNAKKLPGSINMDEVNQEYCCSFQPGVFQVVIIKADISEHKENEEAYQLLVNQVQKLTENELRPGAKMLLSYPAMEGVYFLINMDEEYERELHKKLKIVRTRICTLRDLFWDINATVCMGNTTRDFSQIRESAKEAKRAVLNRIFLGLNHTIGICKKQTSSITVRDIISAQLKSGLQERIEVLDGTEVRRLLDSIYQTVCRALDMDGEVLYAVSLELMDTLLFSLRKISQEVDVTDRREVFMNRFFMCTSVEEVFRQLMEAFAEGIEEVAEIQAQAESKPIRKAKKYIQDYYYEALKLDDISAMLGFNTSYFSGLFKKETGKNFSDYLAQVRISQAKQLLIQEDMGVSEVATEVGYQDLKHFSRLFKRLTGLNPSEFRKLYQKLS